MKALRLLTPVLAIAIGLAGCGGPSAETRFLQRDLRPLQQRLEQDKAALAARLQTARIGDPAAARDVRAHIATIAADTARLTALEAPGSLQPTFRRYTAASGRLVVALRRFARALRVHDRSRLEKTATRTRSLASEILRSQKALAAEIDRHG